MHALKDEIISGASVYKLFAGERQSDVELEGCRLVDAAGGYLCSIRNTCIAIINK